MYWRFRLALAVLAVHNGCSHPPPQYVFIDRGGGVRIRLAPGQQARSFSEGLAAVQVDGRWGYMDKTGRMVIRPRFGGARDFHEGLAAATMAEKDNSFFQDTPFGFIDKSGEFVIPARFSWVGDFAEGLAPVCEKDCVGPNAKGLRGYIDREARYVIAPQFAEAEEFSEGLASAALVRNKYEQWGYVNREGRFLIAPRFVLTYPFRGGVAATGEGIIGRDGKVAIAHPYPRPGGQFASGRILVKLEDEQPIFVDVAGRVVLKPGYQDVGEFSEGLAPACPSDCASFETHTWGFINETGAMVIRPQYGFEPQAFREGLAMVPLAQR